MPFPLDPLAVVADFVDRVAPYDPARGAPPVAVLGVRTAAGAATFTITDHVARALCKALSVYRDPEDRGRCAECGGRRVDENLHCRDCGRLHGILGEVIAHQARRVADGAGAGGADGGGVGGGVGVADGGGVGGGVGGADGAARRAGSPAS